MSFQIKPAAQTDVKTIYDLTVALALYEKKTLDQILVTADKLHQHGFGPNKVFDCVIAWLQGEPVGMAVYFFSYAGSIGDPILYIEDLFVLPEHRSHGMGTKLLQHLASLAEERQCCRMEWHVFDWNDGAKKFYEAIGCDFRPDLIQVRLEAAKFIEFSSHSSRLPA
jgi:GNAT superfamily N-acetyltransferase